jgi:hypothetical protein
MTREDALLKLLRVEPATQAELIAVTGWEVQETIQTLGKLIEDGRATYRNGGHGGAVGYRWFYAKE